MVVSISSIFSIFFPHSIIYAITSTKDITEPVFTFFYNLMMYIFKVITEAMGDTVSGLANTFGISISDIFSDYTQSLYGYGIWAPIIMVSTLGIGGVLIYIILVSSGLVEAID